MCDAIGCASRGMNGRFDAAIDDGRMRFHLCPAHQLDYAQGKVRAPSAGVCDVARSSGAPLSGVLLVYVSDSLQDVSPHAGLPRRRCEVCAAQLVTWYDEDSDLPSANHFCLCPRHLGDLLRHALDQTACRVLRKRHGAGAYLLHDELYAPDGCAKRPIASPDPASEPLPAIQPLWWHD